MIIGAINCKRIFIYIIIIKTNIMQKILKVNQKFGVLEDKHEYNIERSIVNFGSY